MDVYFSDCILIKILQYLHIRDLCKCSRVSRRWKRVTEDSSLWTDVDLRHFRWKLDEHLICRMVQNRFQPCLKRLDLSGFSLTPRIFYELEKNCFNLRTLILENVTFFGFNDLMTRQFPSRLQFLDLRYSSGDKEAFSLIARNVHHLRCFGVTNFILENTNIVEMFRSLEHITTLDFSYCNSLNDATLILIGTFCKELTSLALSHCNNVNGTNLSVITSGCKKLKALSFSGTSLTDSNFIQCNWLDMNLEELDVSWCRNITEDGLLVVLPQLNKLAYLRLCSCGFGHAITDQVLKVLTENNYPDLHTLDVSYSREISNFGTSKLIRSLHALKQIRISCCRRLTVELLNTIQSINSNLLVIGSFKEHQNEALINDGGFCVVPDPDRGNCASIRRYSLEKELKKIS